jgi:hypothetical protein
VNPLELDELIRRFSAGPAALGAAWDRIPAAARQWRPGPGRWSAHEVVLHCADAAAVGHARIRYLLAEANPIIVNWNQDLWAETLDYHAHPIEPAFAVIDSTHTNTLPLLRRLPPAALARPGRHTEYGAITVESYLRSYADHLHVHAQQLDRNLAAFHAHATSG